MRGIASRAFLVVPLCAAAQVALVMIMQQSGSRLLWTWSIYIAPVTTPGLLLLILLSLGIVHVLGKRASAKPERRIPASYVAAALLCLVGGFYVARWTGLLAPTSLNLAAAPLAWRAGVVALWGVVAEGVTAGTVRWRRGLGLFWGMVWIFCGLLSVVYGMVSIAAFGDRLVYEDAVPLLAGVAVAGPAVVVAWAGAVFFAQYMSTRRTAHGL